MSHIHPFTARLAPLINVQSTLCTTPDLCKNVPHTQYYLVATIIHIHSPRSQICVYVHILHSTETSVRQKTFFKKLEQP